MCRDNAKLQELIETVRKKPEANQLVHEVMGNSEMIPLLLEIVKTDPGSLKFFCAQVIRTISEKSPVLVYPYFNDIAPLMDSSNNILKWSAIIILSNLALVDSENKFAGVYQRYLSLMDSTSMITAGNVAGNAWKIAVSHPGWERDITERLLAIAGNTYMSKGKPSPECKNIMLGNVLGCFDRYFHLSGSKSKMIDFATMLTENPRKSVARRAEDFVLRHATSASDDGNRRE
jgi:hypothetical protein